uniref:Outer dense fiber protein 3 n=1 Tax=Timema cristinae TaxID=61476 RepID=A0A7R9GTB2_TIMCR|nr:unnamed protein product [Timema cristinae]
MTEEKTEKESSIMGGITQQPWTPTKRRGPIAAEYSSPGPACVTLQSSIGGSTVPDSKKGRAPAFSFGSRHSSKNDSPGPGPKYNITGLSSKGKDSPPAATLHSRPKDHHVDNTPAPGDYSPEKTVDHSPKYTFGLKTQTDKPSTTPAPNVYNIPGVLGQTREGNKKQAPSFTISGRQKEHLDDRVLTPGPGTYDSAKSEFTKSRSPAYSISSRYQLPSDSTQKPGPGAHYPEKDAELMEGGALACRGPDMIGRAATYSSSGIFVVPFHKEAMGADSDLADHHQPSHCQTTQLGANWPDPVPSWVRRGIINKLTAASLTPTLVPTLTSQVLLHKTWAPAHSFGIKHSPYIATPHLLAEDKLNKGMMM